jgi:hypothetical protein
MRDFPSTLLLDFSTLQDTWYFHRNSECDRSYCQHHPNRFPKQRCVFRMLLNRPVHSFYQSVRLQFAMSLLDFIDGFWLGEQPLAVFVQSVNESHLVFPSC